MSELKAFDITVAEEYYCEGIVKYRRAVYDKPEVDKVIAELKADYKEACDRLQTANLIKDEQLAATRHHKYKRCLAMAVICFNRAERANCWKEEVKSRKRFEKWLELSKKFKQGLVIGVDKATGTDKTVSINYKEAK